MATEELSNDELLSRLAEQLEGNAWANLRRAYEDTRQHGDRIVPSVPPIRNAIDHFTLADILRDRITPQP